VLEAILTILGFLGGAVIEGNGGAIAGACMGFLAGFAWRNRRLVREQARQLAALREQVEHLQARLEPTELEFDIPDQFTEPATPVIASEPGSRERVAPTQGRETPQTVTMARAQGQPAPPAMADTPAPGPRQDSSGTSPSEVPAADWSSQSADPRDHATNLLSRGVAALMRFVRGGNPMVRIGVIVLFFGIAFLAKLAIDADLFPIELRMAAIAGVGIALALAGFRVRLTRPAFALPLQGGGMAVLFLSVFAAYRLYQLLPATLCFALLVALVAFTVLLAVLQNSMVLAAMGVAGGFVAPVLASSGSGDHVGLFSYFLLLNLGIFAIAWRKAWRILNWLGFLFTFGIGTAWGAKYYTPELFSTTEPFLIAHFVLYVIISVLFALRQPPALRGLVDSTLVFGTPLVTFGLQSQLVAHIPMGLAYSAVGAAAIYIALGLWMVKQAKLKLLLQAFIANGVVLASIAVPLALDARWTAVTWAVEGVGALWIGTRQGRVLPRIGGIALQFLAGASFCVHLAQDPLRTAPLFLGNTFLGALTVALAGLFCAAYIYRCRNRLHRIEGYAHWLLGAWGFAWWYGAGLFDVAQQGSNANEWGVTLLFLAGSLLAALALLKRESWPGWRFPTLATIWGLFLVLLAMAIDERHPLKALGWLGWPVAVGAQLFTLWHIDDRYGKFLQWLHAATHWLMILLVTWAAAYWVQRWAGGHGLWEPVMWGLIPGVALLLTCRAVSGDRWPWAALPRAYLVIASSPIVVMLGLWLVLVNADRPGRAWPIDYLPMLNPIDIAIGFALLGSTVWWRQGQRLVKDWPFLRCQRAAIGLLAAGLFLWVNAIVLRSVHFWAGVRYDFDALWRSNVTQSSLAILWSVLGVLGMVLAARKGHRLAWFCAAGLMGLVVLKLFFVDLANTNTLERVISFVSVGVLMVIVGYFAPVPPRPPAARASES